MPLQRDRKEAWSSRGVGRGAPGDTQEEHRVMWTRDTGRCWEGAFAPSDLHTPYLPWVCSTVSAARHTSSSPPLASPVPANHIPKSTTPVGLFIHLRCQKTHTFSFSSFLSSFSSLLLCFSSSHILLCSSFSRLLASCASFSIFSRAAATSSFCCSSFSFSFSTEESPCECSTQITSPVNLSIS